MPAYPPVSVLQVVQAGFETTPGSNAAATRVIEFEVGKAVLKRTIANITVPRAGSRAGAGAASAGIEDVELEIPFAVSTDDWPWWGNLFFMPLVSGTGGGNAKTYVQAPPDTITAIGSNSAVAAVQSASFEVGGKDTWPLIMKVVGVIGKKLDVTIRPGDLWKAKATLQGTATNPAGVGNALTPALSSLATRLASAQYAAGVLTKVYLDTPPNGFGGTQAVGRAVSADISIDLKPVARHTFDGVTTATRMALPDAYDITAKLTVEFGNLNEYNAWIAHTTQRLRVSFVGASISGGGNHTINLDTTGVWKTLDIVEDAGIFAVSLELDQLFDASISAGIQSTTVNTVATLP